MSDIVLHGETLHDGVVGLNGGVSKKTAKLSLRLPVEVLAELKAAASVRRRSVSFLALDFIEEGLGRPEKQKVESRKRK